MESRLESTDLRYTPDEDALEIPCRVWLPSEYRSILVDLTRLPPEAMTIDVIAHSLSTKNRFNGHCPWPYSVATHSILVSGLLTADEPPLMLELEALLHDASETFVGDVIHPIKRKLPDFKVIEGIVDAQLRAFYGLPAEETPDVKLADTKALWLEQHFLQGKEVSLDARDKLSWRDVYLGRVWLMEPIRWQDSREAFQTHYAMIMKEVAS